MSVRQRTYRQKPGVPPAFRINDPITEQEIFALRAVERGEADPNQQKLALRLILLKLCGTYDQEFVPSHADQSAFRGGRGFVGKTAMKLLKADIDILLGDEHEE